jgi:hypothetical protein
MTWLKYEIVAITVGLCMAVLAQIAAWGGWLVWWGSEGRMPDPVLFALKAAGISLIAFVVSTIIASIIVTVAAGGGL